MRRKRGVRGRGWRKWALLVAGAGFVLLNAVAYMQAWSMTHFVEGTGRTSKPEALSLPEKAWTLLTGVSISRPTNSHTPADVGLPFEVRRIPFDDGSYMEGWFVPHEAAPGIVLMFPGYAESKESLLAQAAALHEMGYSLLMLDFRGAGGSSGNSTTLGVREAGDVARAAAYAGSQWPGSRAVLYGVSMGGAAVLRAVAVEGVAPSALILESPFDCLLTTASNRFHAMGLPATPGAALVIFWGSVQQGFNGFTHNPVDYASSVHCPTLILHGDHDPRVSLPQARSIYDNLRGQKQFVVFAGAGHESLISFAPGQWKGSVGLFLGAVQH